MAESVRKYLGMKHQIVGVKINEKSNDAFKPQEPMWFCQMVYDASMGKDFLIEADDLACPNAEIALGFREPRYVEIEPRIKDKVRSLRIGKIQNVDIVLLILTPDQVMALSILLGGVNPYFKGEMGVCGEAVARVYQERRANLSFLCQGARIFGNFRANEIVFGIPKQEFDELEKRIENLLKTGGSLCGCQVSDISQEIIKSFQSIGFEKGTDYFFGKIEDYQVRIYLNKDEKGRFKFLTIYLPIKVKGVVDKIKVPSPFQVRTRGKWTDIYGVFDPDTIGINLYTGKNMLPVFTQLVKKAMKGM
jgi:uncharacterized protein (DUF169 family)